MLHGRRRLWELGWFCKLSPSSSFLQPLFKDFNLTLPVIQVSLCALKHSFISSVCLTIFRGRNNLLWIFYFILWDQPLFIDIFYVKSSFFRRYITEISMSPMDSSTYYGSFLSCVCTLCIWIPVAWHPSFKYVLLYICLVVFCVIHKSESGFVRFQLENDKNTGQRTVPGTP